MHLHYTREQVKDWSRTDGTIGRRESLVKRLSEDWLEQDKQLAAIRKAAADVVFALEGGQFDAILEPLRHAFEAKPHKVT